MGDGTSLLAQTLDGRLASADSLLMTVRVHLSVILSMDRALRNFVNFTFDASHLFSAGGRQSSTAA